MEEIKQFIEEHISEMDSPQKVYQLFEGLGYKTLDPSFRGKEAFGLREKDREAVKEIYTIANYQKRFQIFLVELTQPSTAIIRSLPLYFERETQYPFFVLTSDYRQYTFVLVEKIREDVGIWKRKTVRLNLDRENAYYTDKWILSEIAAKDEKDPVQIYNILSQSFSVEKVTNKFFDEYIRTFNAVKGHFLKQTKDKKFVHNFTQQLLNRIMFIYFVAKKRWLGNDLKFMSSFWEIYSKGKKKGDYQPDTFYDNWLSVLFFEAFNNRFSPRRYFPDGLNKTLMLAPYLNGGLFTRNRLDDIGFSIKDSVFENIFAFLNRYNFTIREELPLEEEVAVDPEMIGRVYESLVNLSEESDERGEAGIFYTDRVEIDFMSRRSLVEYFYNQLQREAITKDLVYKFIFAKTDDEKKVVEKELNKFKIWPKMEDALDNLSILDPACGSGSFLVGMLNILAGLYKLTYKNLNRAMDDFEIKKQIIGRSLYGVDVIDWACHVAELRLWLQLIVESELNIGDLKIKPLLPNLTFKIRSGDSLVQEIGGINLSLKNNRYIKPALKRKITELKQEKLKFFNNDPSRKYKSEELLLHAELNIFREILSDRILTITNTIKSKQKGPDTKGQKELFSFEEIYKTEKERQRHFELVEQVDKKVKEEITRRTQERELLREIQSTLDKGTKPFVWDIDFVEIFSDEFEGGFDIVIGNPPYVRQEKIADPKIPKEKITNENKREYKEKLFYSIQSHFPFIKSLSKKSDLYIYFYFQGLSLLNQTGTFCFITSNSWLDVDYGKELQEFLLNNLKIYAIYDNSAKRSFARADINTIIAVFGTPKPKEEKENFENLAKFVMFKKSFGDVLTIDNLLKIEEAKEITKTNDFRVYPKRQVELLEEGWEYPKDITEEQKKIYKFNIGKYEGNKWGGKYLRAPDIFFTLLEDIGKRFNYLIDCGELGIGLVTGVNDFFIIKDDVIKNAHLDKKYLFPIVKSPKELKKINIDKKQLEYNLLLLSEGSIVDNYLRDYIKLGEKQKYHLRPTCKARKLWYKLEQKPAPILFPYIIGERHATFLNEDLVFTSRELERFIPFDTNLYKPYCAYFNSIIIALFREIMGRINLGDGALKLEVLDIRKMPTLMPEIIKSNQKKLESVLIKISYRPVKSIFEECGFNSRLSIREQEPNPLPDRRELDDIVFDILGLTKQERKEVYWAVCELVKNRLEKARSV